MALEIREQPDALEHVLRTAPARIREALDTLAASRPDGLSGRVVFAGCGDMSFAAETVARHAHLEGMGFNAWRSMDARWSSQGVVSTDLVVVASVSGRTARTVEAATLAREAGAAVLGITASPGAALGEVCDAVLPLELCDPALLEQHEYAGYQNAIGQTKSYVAVLLMELALASELGRRRGLAEPLASIAAVPERLRDSLGGLEESVRAVVSELRASTRDVVVLGSGPWLATAEYAAAKWLELAGSGRARCIEEYHHLDMFVADDATTIVLLALDEASHGRVAEVAGPLGELGAHRLVIRAEGCGAPLEGLPEIVLPECGRIERLFLVTAAVQLLAMYGGAALGRDVTRWLGGCRTDLLTKLGSTTIRASRILDRRPGADPA